MVLKKSRDKKKLLKSGGYVEKKFKTAGEITILLAQYFHFIKGNQ